MNSVKFAIATRQLGLPTPRAFDAAADLGVQGIQLDVRYEVHFKQTSDSGVRQLHHLIAERQLKLASALLPTRYALSESEHIDQRIDAIRDAMSFVSQLKGKDLIVRLGTLPDDPASRPYEKLTEIVSDLAAAGNHLGVRLVLSIGPTQSDEILAFLDLIKTGPVGIDFDTYSMLSSGVNLEKSFAQLKNYLAHATLQDGLQEQHGRYRPVPIGEGEIEWLPLMAMLSGLPQQTWKTLLASQNTQPLQELRATLETLKPLTAFF